MTMKLERKQQRLETLSLCLNKSSALQLISHSEQADSFRNEICKNERNKQGTDKTRRHQSTGNPERNQRF